MGIKIVKAYGMIGNDIKKERVVYYTQFNLPKALEAMKYHLYKFYIYDFKLATRTIPGWYKLREYNDQERAKGRFEEMMRVERAEKRAIARKLKKANEKLQAGSRDTKKGDKKPK
jgi:hypothetical protein